MKYKKEKKLDVKKDLMIGLEVAFGRMKVNKRFIYKHHGIIINICFVSSTFEIVELLGDGNAYRAVSCSSLKPIVATTSVSFEEGDLFYYDYSQYSFPYELIKDRAELMLQIFDKSKVQYQLYSFNCEHFASYCSTGMAFSRQCSDVNIKATKALDKA